MSVRPPPPNRLAGDLALDLANTISSRETEREVDHVADVAGITSWATATGLVEPGYAASPTSEAALVADVHALRAAIMAAGEAIAGHAAPDEASLAVIRDLAARTLASAKVEGVPATLTFAPDDRIVGPIAWAALDLFRGRELDRLKQCPPDDCRWLFLDRSKNRSRRWCDMATCGNREKARRAR